MVMQEKMIIEYLVTSIIWVKVCCLLEEDCRDIFYHYYVGDHDNHYLDKILGLIEYHLLDMSYDIVDEQEEMADK